MAIKEPPITHAEPAVATSAHPLYNRPLYAADLDLLLDQAVVVDAYGVRWTKDGAHALARWVSVVEPVPGVRSETLTKAGPLHLGA